MTPTQRRAVVRQAQAHFALRLGTACRYLAVHRALVRYTSRRTELPGLAARIRELATEKPRWGAPRLTWRLRREGWRVNHKRIERLLRVEDLRVGQRVRRRKRSAIVRFPTPLPTRPDVRWSMDFVRDTTADGRPFRIWALVDDCTRECPLLLVDRSLPARRVVDGLEALLQVRACPATIVCDNGPEFVSLALDQWASGRGIRLDFIRPGRPVENCFIESFNGKLRDECLNLHHFHSLHDAREALERWREEYNTTRPHRGLGLQTPAEFAARFTSEERHSSSTHSDVAVA